MAATVDRDKLVPYGDDYVDLLDAPLTRWGFNGTDYARLGGDGDLKGFDTGSFEGKIVDDLPGLGIS